MSGMQQHDGASSRPELGLPFSERAGKLAPEDGQRHPGHEDQRDQRPSRAPWIFSPRRHLEAKTRPHGDRGKDAQKDIVDARDSRLGQYTRAPPFQRATARSPQASNKPPPQAAPLTPPTEQQIDHAA